MPRRRRRCLLALLLVSGLATGTAEAAADPLASSRKCRAAIAAGTAKIVALQLKLVDACHVRRTAGKHPGACLPLVLADPKGRVAAAEAKIRTAIDKACRPGDPVRDNFSAGLVAAALLPHVRELLGASAAALQGAPVLAGDKPAAKCHAAIGKARSALVARVLKDATTCQKARDKRATSFGPLADACVLDPAKMVAKAAASVAKACRRKDGTPITGADVGSCDPLPGCVVDAAIATGRAVAAAAYARPSACGDGIRAADESCPLLEGVDDAPALGAITTMDVEPGVPASEITETPEGARVARTRLEIALAPAATVGAVNALLAAIDGSILMAVANAPVLLVRIPDPGSLGALEAVVADVRAHPSVRFATAGVLPEPDLLPDNFDPAQAGGADLTKIDHLLAVGAPAAWNARGALPALAERPLMVVGDFFGDGPPDAAVDVADVVADDFATGDLDPSGHGYHVLGIIAARLGGPACAPPAPGSAAAARGCATGMFPGTLPLRVVDGQKGLTLGGIEIRLIQILALAGRRAVVSTSLNACPYGTCGNPLAAAERGVIWAELVRGQGLEDDFLHLTSAGNIRSATPTVIDALTNSGFTAAALFDGGLFDGFGLPIPTLANTLVVENARHTAEPFAPRCLHDDSKRGGHLAGIGANVWSLRDAAGVTAFCISGGCTQEASWPPADQTLCTVGNSAPCQAGNKTGTSMATPEVAALAAYLWALAPALSVAELRALLVATATATGNDGGADLCDAAAPKPVIDAYGAVLALDDTVPPSPATAPMRHAILDADDDGVFDGGDLGLFLERYFDGFTDAATHGPPVNPASREYGRFDLNGDGFTGGPGTRPFDLDRVGSPPLAPPLLARVFQELSDGGGVFFEQDGLTDLEILCYYAHSALYQGSDDERDALVDPAWCNPVAVDAGFVGFEEDDLAAGEPATLRVTVTHRDATGATRPLAGVRVEVDVDGGSGGGSATTDETGRVERTVTPGSGSEEVSVVIRVRPAPGGIVLAEDEVSVGVDEEDDAHDECADFRPDGVYLFSRSSIAYGNSVAYYFPAGSQSSTLIHLDEDQDRLRDRDDLPGAASDDYFGSWQGAASGGRSGTRGGVSSSGSYMVGHTSEMQGQSVVIPYPDGDGDYAGFLFQGFSFQAAATTTITHSNSGMLRAQTSAVANGATCVDFSVVGAPAGYAFAGEIGAGAYIELSGSPCAEEHAEVYAYYINEPAPYPPGTVEDELPRGGLLQPGFYQLCVTLSAYSRVSTNQPANSQPDNPGNKQRELAVQFTVQ